MAATDALFDALRIPWQIVVDNSFTKLQVQSFCARLSTHEDFRTRPKLMYKSKAHRNFAAGPGDRRKPRAFLLSPERERLLRTIMIVDAAEQGNVIITEPDGEEELSQVFLCGDRFCKNNCLAAAMTVPPTIENHLDRILEGARLGI